MQSFVIVDMSEPSRFLQIVMTVNLTTWSSTSICNYGGINFESFLRFHIALKVSDAARTFPNSTFSLITSGEYEFFLHRSDSNATHHDVWKMGRTWKFNTFSVLEKLEAGGGRRERKMRQLAGNLKRVSAHDHQRVTFNSKSPFTTTANKLLEWPEVSWFSVNTLKQAETSSTSSYTAQHKCLKISFRILCE